MVERKEGKRFSRRNILGLPLKVSKMVTLPLMLACTRSPVDLDELFPPVTTPPDPSETVPTQSDVVISPTTAQKESLAFTEEKQKTILDTIYNARLYSQQGLDNFDDSWQLGTPSPEKVTFTEISDKGTSDELGVWVSIRPVLNEISDGRTDTSDIWVKVNLNPILFEIQGVLVPTGLDKVDVLIANYHSLYTYASLAGIARLLYEYGINPLKSKDDQLREVKLSIPDIEDIILNAHSFIKTRSYLSAFLRSVIFLINNADKDSEGQVLFQNRPEGDIQELEPSIDGMPINEDGVLQTAFDIGIADYLEGFRDIYDIQSSYRDFREIPHWETFENYLLDEGRNNLDINSTNKIASRVRGRLSLV